MGVKTMELDPLAQQPIFQHLYTQITLCFPLAEDADPALISGRLSAGIRRAAASFPWLSGQIVSKKGTLFITPFGDAPRLSVKDLRDNASTPSLSEMEQAGMPMAMLDEDLVSWRKTFATDEGPREVLSVQAVFIRGGLMLTFTASHAAMDATGQGHVVALVAKACRGHDFTMEELRAGNLDRTNLVPLLDQDYEPGPEVADQILVRPTDQAAAADEADRPGCSWAYFNFSRDSLVRIKAAAIATRSQDTAEAPFVSTDDAVTTFIWQSVTRARLARLGQSSLSSLQEVKLTRAVDVRSHFGVPETYPGLLQNLNYHVQRAGSLVQPDSLGAVAASLRAALLPKPEQDQGWDVARRTRALVTMLARSGDKSRISLTASVDGSKDLMLSSWMMLKTLYDRADFGAGLGRPVAIRRPRFDAVEGLAYMLPALAAEGGMALAICLRDDDLERLRSDVEFGRNGVYAG